MKYTLKIDVIFGKIFDHFQMLTDLENLKNSRESKIEKIWQELQTVIKKHWEQTEDRRKEYLVMREIDYENCKQIFENNQQINGIIVSNCK